jgi:uncharacterized membrane protein
MTPRIVQGVLRARRLFYFVIALVVTLLMSVVTIRFAFGGEGETFETVLLAVLTLALAFQTRRWFRRFREIPPEQ